MLAYAAGPLADLEWRRGWTHGVLALVVLPFLLTGGLLLVAKIRVGRWRHSPPPVSPRQLLLLSSVALLSHPMLDTLNTYGVRWLMPFSERWFYGDVLFIVDPWLWLMLAAGVLATWYRQRKAAGAATRPVRMALSLALVYIATMMISSVAARTIVATAITDHFGGAVHAIMAGPLPLTPVIRAYVVEQEGHYRVGTFHWLRRPHLDITQVVSYPHRQPSDHPAYAVAESTVVFRRFLGWARFPTLSLERLGAGHYLVHAVDLRYSRSPGQGFGTVAVPVTVPASSGDSY